MSGGGSGGAQTQMGDWSEALKPRWTGALDIGEQIAMGENWNYKPFGGQRIAGLDNDQSRAMQYTRDFVDYSGNPLPATDGARNEITKTLGGGYLGKNPWSSTLNPYADTEANKYAKENNPWAATFNPYQGENPQFNDHLNRTLLDTANAYQEGTSAETTRMANLAGAFSGSSHEKAIANNQTALGKALGSVSDRMRTEQFDKSAGLEENRLNRGFQQHESQLGRGYGATEAALSRGLQGWQQQVGMGNQAWENERGRMAGAVGQGQAEQGLTLDRARALMGVGDIDRSLQQDYLNLGYNDWQEANQHPFKMLDYFTGLLGRSQGGMAPNMTTTTSGYGASPFSQLLGAGLLGYGMMGK